MKTCLTLIALMTLSAAAALAGPPLICQPYEIGNAKSLPWTAKQGWRGTLPGYDVNSLANDTLAILTPDATLELRMETMRRAVIYAASAPKSDRIAFALAARLQARALDSEAAGRKDPMAWFDAGYWVESVRQASFIYRFDMLNREERETWRIRAGLPGFDGRPWIEKAIRSGGKGMDRILGLLDGYRKADQKDSSE